MINSITQNKPSLLDDPDFNKEFNSYGIVRQLSNNDDCIQHANFINMNSHLDKRMQYMFLRGSIRKKFRRAGKWKNPDATQSEQAVMEYYQCNHRRAKEYCKMLPDDEIKRIEQKMNTGGKT